MLSAWRAPLDPVFPEKAKSVGTKPIQIPLYAEQQRKACSVKIAKPRVFIPVFPGTNCEYDTIKAFEKEGAIATPLIFKNLSAADIEDSVAEMKRLIDEAQIIMIPGGFSGGDEPDGSGKFIATAFLNDKVCGYINIWVIVALVVFEEIIAFVFCPVENKNKPIEKEKKPKFKAMGMIVFLLLDLFGGAIINRYQTVGSMILLTNLLIAVLIISAKIKEKRCDKNEII